jgi:hypothetical protein
MPSETPGLRGDSAKEYHKFLRKVERLEQEKAEQRARAEELDAELLEEAAEEAEDAITRHERETAAAAKRAAAGAWRRGMGLDDE